MTAKSDFFSIDKKLYPGYTKNMKTAVSLSDALFEVAEQTAQYMGISRSRLYANALEDYISRHSGEMITQKLNEVYGKMTEEDLKEFEPDLEVGLESLRELTKNDTW
jgi:NAD(P)H-dependent FMN reductase